MRGPQSPHIVARRVLPKFVKFRKGMRKCSGAIFTAPRFRIDDAPARASLCLTSAHKSATISGAHFSKPGAEIAFTVGCRHGRRYHRWLPFWRDAPVGGNSPSSAARGGIHKIKDRLDERRQICSGSCRTPATARTAFTFW